MRLLNTQTLRLEDFASDALPPYAILSHTWGNAEVSFQSLESGNYASQGNGYLKIRGCCKTALLDGFEYVWVDTCCINKESSAELSEAINSMYRWYSDSDVCYVYLSDVPRDRTIPIVEGFSARETSIVKSRYFTRSWTLQELIAPQSVIFFDKDWHELGTKASLSRLITYATGIQTEMILNMVGLNAFSVAQRMAWASKRYASREEDVAYSLIGISEHADALW
ncbi:heterokaryon incompatibility protein-domain-containing protein [Bisporella sp. PMI_857]|nr:heterokaryon incompatibility protein-domain-containing protein [Bisporella sp. PMI_857]